MSFRASTNAIIDAHNYLKKKIVEFSWTIFYIDCF